MITENKYTDAQILQFMATNTDLDVAGTAAALGIETIQVGQAQHNKMKKIFSKYRNSLQWVRPGYYQDTRSFLNKLQLQTALNKINAGHEGVIEKYSSDFKISKLNMEILQHAAINNF